MNIISNIFPKTKYIIVRINTFNLNTLAGPTVVQINTMDGSFITPGKTKQSTEKQITKTLFRHNFLWRDQFKHRIFIYKHIPISSLIELKLIYWRDSFRLWFHNINTQLMQTREIKTINSSSKHIIFVAKLTGCILITCAEKLPPKMDSKFKCH